MGHHRRNQSPQRKANAVMAVLRGDKMICELAEQHQVPPDHVPSGSSGRLENSVAAFDGKTGGRVCASEPKDLHATLGQSTLKSDFLFNAFRDAWWLNARR